jgi:hypothetical protein
MHAIAEEKVMTIPKTILLAGAAGTTLVLGSVADWPQAGPPVQRDGIPPFQTAIEHRIHVARCGDEADTDGILLQHPLPNAYMTANGRVFSLAGLVRCTARLHTARLS